MTSTPFHHDDSSHATSANFTGSEIGRSGMVLFLINEATLFACLVSSYFYLAVANVAWPPAGIHRPSLMLPLIMTAVLLSSSGVLVYAERERERGNRSRFRLGVGVTALLGIAFLVLQTKEYAEKLVEMSPSTSAYASLFYSITGLHGAHVAFGVLFLIWSALAGAKLEVSSGRSLTIRNAALYWHFVDGVWLVILTSLYISPRWS